MPDATLVRARLASPRVRLAALPALFVALTVAVLASLVVTPRDAAAQRRDTTTARDTTKARAATPADSARADTTRRDTTRAAARKPRGRPRQAAARGQALPDSIARPPISPRRAFLYSLLVPGEGQTALRRRRAAALFATIELGTVAMIAKSKNDLRIARARPDTVTTIDIDPLTGDSTITKVPDRLKARVKARRLHVEDWMATLLFNHLFSGADAFVAAQLWDLPAQVSFQAIPRGGAVTISVPW